MADPAGLARRAQQALAAPTSASLVIQGRTEPARTTTAVVLHEDAGRPRMICDAGSPVRSAAQARRPAILTVPCEPHSTARFAGELEICAIETVDGYPHYVVGIRLRSVFVDEHQVPLAVYLAASADLLEQYAARLLGHTNACHSSELRGLVADWLDVPADTIAAARLATVARHGVVIEWVDEHGAHTRHLDFPRAAATSTELSQALQSRLRR